MRKVLFIMLILLPVMFMGTAMAEETTGEVVPPSEENSGAGEVVPPSEENSGAGEVLPPSEENSGAGEVLPPSEIEQWVGDNVVPTITAGLAAAGGTLASIIILIKTIRKLISSIKGTLEMLGIRKDTLELTDKKLEQTIERLEQAEVKNNKLIEEIGTLKEMVKIGFCNDEYLVRNGYARDIERVSNESKEKAV